MMGARLLLYHLDADFNAFGQIDSLVQHYNAILHVTALDHWLLPLSSVKAPLQDMQHSTSSF